MQHFIAYQHHMNIVWCIFLPALEWKAASKGKPEVTFQIIFQNFVGSKTLMVVELFGVQRSLCASEIFGAHRSTEAVRP